MSSIEIDNVEIVHIDRNGYNSIYCLDDCIATIANKENLDYQLMYSNYQKLFYDYEKAFKDKKVISALSYAVLDENIYDILERKHGLRLKDYYELTQQQTLSIINSELLKKRVILVRLDSYYCAWDVLYEKEHTKHMALCIGLGDDKVILCDPFYGLNNIQMDINSFIKANHGRIITYDVKNGSNKLSQTSKDEILSRYIEDKIFENRTNNLLKMAGAFGDIFKYENEYDDFDEAFKSFDMILNIVIKTSKFFNLLKYIKPINENIQSIMDEIIGSWVVVKNILFKSFFTKKYDIGKKIEKRILEIVKNEQSIYNYFCQGTYNNQVENDLKELVCLCQKTTEKYENSFTDSVDISYLLNNNSFGDYRNDKCESDFTGLNEFLQYDNIKQIIDIDNNRKVSTLITPDNRCDNIMCDGQCVNVNSKELYKHIGFIVVSEFGETIDILKVLFDDGKQQKIHIKVSDVNVEPLFGEKTIWRGVTYQRGEKNNISLRLNNAHLFWVEYELNNNSYIDRLLLPECSNLHIYGIYLFK